MPARRLVLLIAISIAHPAAASNNLFAQCFRNYAQRLFSSTKHPLERRLGMRIEDALDPAITGEFPLQGKFPNVMRKAYSILAILPWNAAEKDALWHQFIIEIQRRNPAWQALSRGSQDGSFVYQGPVPGPDDRYSTLIISPQGDIYSGWHTFIADNSFSMKNDLEDTGRIEASGAREFLNKFDKKFKN